MDLFVLVICAVLRFVGEFGFVFGFDSLALIISFGLWLVVFVWYFVCVWCWCAFVGFLVG